jgi:hypothetical protein
MKINTDNIVELITEDEILNRTTEYDIYVRYIPTKFEIGRIISSPFGKTHTPHSVFSNPVKPDPYYLRIRLLEM